MRRSERKYNRTTLKDIAREANVSPTTVSLVMCNKDTPRVSVFKRERILKIAKRLGYRPNFIARSLVTRKSYTIGLVITTLLNPFYAEIAQDIIDRVKQQGYGVLTCLVRGGLNDESRSVNDLLDRGVDGLIICSSLRHDPVVYGLTGQEIPVVLALRYVEQKAGDVPLDYIVVDNKRGAFIAVDHLLKMKHKRIALITGPQETATAYDRMLGALSAFESHGIKSEKGLILAGDFHRGTGYELTRKLIQKRRPPTAIFAVNDHMAMGVLDALREENLRVPEDMALVGFDDIEMASLPGIDLTTVSQKKRSMGRLAVDHLIEKIKAKSSGLVKRIILDPILVIRKTCGSYLQQTPWQNEGNVT